jgi:hypothetical protein
VQKTTASKAPRTRTARAARRHFHRALQSTCHRYRARAGVLGIAPACRASGRAPWVQHLPARVPRSNPKHGGRLVLHAPGRRRRRRRRRYTGRPAAAAAMIGATPERAAGAGGSAEEEEAGLAASARRLRARPALGPRSPGERARSECHGMDAVRLTSPSPLFCQHTGLHLHKRDAHSHRTRSPTTCGRSDTATRW